MPPKIQPLTHQPPYFPTRPSSRCSLPKTRPVHSLIVSLAPTKAVVQLCSTGYAAWLKPRLIVRLLAEAENALVSSAAQIAQKRGVEQQRMVAIVGDVVLLERDRRIVVIEEHGLARLQNRHALAVDARGVEQDRRAGGAEKFFHVLQRQPGHVAALEVERSLLAMDCP